MIKNKYCPLVSVLIPTYNRPHYLKTALESALQQTYENIEIIICDDSTNRNTVKMMIPYLNKYKNIKYYYNGGPLGVDGLRNTVKCLKLSSGEYINFLFDDDVFHPEKIKRMIECFYDYENIVMVTSHRQTIDKDGISIPHMFSAKIFKQDTILNGHYAGRKMITTFKNFIGEPTTVLFKKKYIDRWSFFGGKQFRWIDDMAMWIELCSKGDCMYLSDTLSYLRIHNGQNGKKTDYDHLVYAYGELIYIIEGGYKTGFLSEKEYNKILQKWKRRFPHIIHIIQQNYKYAHYLEDLQRLKIV